MTKNIYVATILKRIIKQYTQELEWQSIELSILSRKLIKDMLITDEFLKEFNDNCNSALDKYALMALFPGSSLGKLSNLRKLARDLYAEGHLSESLSVLAKVTRISKNDKDVQLLHARGEELRLIVDPEISIQEFPGQYRKIKNSILHFSKIDPKEFARSKLRSLLIELGNRGYSNTVVLQTQHLRYLTNSPQFDDKIKIIYTAPPNNDNGNLDDAFVAKFKEILEIAASSGPSVIHCHGGHINFLIANYISRSFRVPLVWNIAENPKYFHIKTTGVIAETEIIRSNSMGSDSNSSAARMSEKYKVQVASCIVADSTKAIQRARTIGKPCEDLFLLDNFSFITNEGTNDKLVENHPALSSGSSRIGFLIEETMSNNHDATLKAISVLVDENPGLGLSILTTSGGDPGFLLSLHSYSLLSEIDIVSVAENDSIQSMLETLDMVVINSDTGDLSAKLIEEMYPLSDDMDLPKVCFVTNHSGVDGIFEPADDYRVISAAIQSRIINPRLISSSVETPVSVASSSNLFSRVADDLSSVYKSQNAVPVRFESVDERGHISMPQSTDRRSRTKVRSRNAAIMYLQLHGVDEIPTGKTEASNTIGVGWSAYGYLAVKLDLPLKWREVGPEDRSWRMHFHSWEFMHAPLMQWAGGDDNHYLLWCVERAISWADEFTNIEDVASMAWYDMSLAYRTVVLVSLLRATEHSDSISNLQYHKLLKLAELHRDAHYVSESFNPRNNHGYYSAVSQILLGTELSDLPGMEALVLQGEERLRMMTDGQFLGDGGHSEHSPDYHRMLLGGFEVALSMELIRDRSVQDRITKAAEVLGWMIQPDGHLVQFGDTPFRSMVGRNLRSTSSQTQWILSSGAEGQATDSKMLVLPETGYVFIRRTERSDFEDFAKSSYLALTSAFHSRAHKHCDDNSLVWFEHGQQILIDGGRYRYGDLLPVDSELRKQGFYYADPTRQLMETAAAHSTVSMGGSLHDRRRKPHGSGIISACETQTEVFQLESQTPHGLWTHRRQVQFRPQRELLVVDRIGVHGVVSNDFYIWWQFDGSLSLKQEDSVIYIGSPMWKKEMLRVELAVAAENIEIFKGDEQLLGGWRSKFDRNIEESWSIKLKVAVDKEIEVPTTFRFQKLETNDAE